MKNKAVIIIGKYYTNDFSISDVAIIRTIKSNKSSFEHSEFVSKNFLRYEMRKANRRNNIIIRKDN